MTRTRLDWNQRSGISALLLSTIAVLVVALLPNLRVQAQSCRLTLSGKVIDRSTNLPLSYAEILLEDQGKLVVCDANGAFSIQNLCAGELHLQVTHVGCHSVHTYLNLVRDTLLTIYLAHNAEFLNEAIVHGEHGSGHVHRSNTLDEHRIGDESQKSLAELIESIPGISSLKGGSGIAKPVIQGLYGNRIAILNNGLLHGGQLWGNDHAPEIDPFTAGEISVVKGAGALEYGGNSLGGIVVIKPNRIKEDPNLHGRVNYALASNGLGHTLNTAFEKREDRFGWRGTFTMKRSGDNRAADYYLTNTGRSELAGSILMDPKWGVHWKHELYYSYIHSRIGILRGSHIGNLSDLQAAMRAEVPLFTSNDFSYAINEPRQEVNHHLLKWESVYSRKTKSSWRGKYGLQLNQRREFDVRRAGRSEDPALSLQQYTHFMEFSHVHYFADIWTYKGGLQYQIRDNYNIPGTGILPLIPNYREHTPGLFQVLQRRASQSLLEFGMRFDHRNLAVWKLEMGPPRSFEYVVRNFNPYAISAGYRYALNDSLSLFFNASHHLRAPEVNELYSFGLHQGVSGIEEGNPGMVPERSTKLSATIDWIEKRKWIVQWGLFGQYIRDFMYLEPTGTYSLTIRGAFPLFRYEQTHAALLGNDLLLSFAPSDHWKYNLNASLIRGFNLSEQIPLLYIPADNARIGVQYAPTDGKSLSNRTFGIAWKGVARQYRLEDWQDFMPAPDAYGLFELNLGAYKSLKRGGLDMHLTVENVLNKAYRDYLNRLRYFADEAGRNFVFRINYHFEND
ncbi:MAG: TonB-dependent receptor [Flavobacteriales bacterium]|nr:TonB-dependent receptor [Flavobacteriales bacterium]